nr:MAG TPA: hypothetical protein [Crassvirales sp.]
MEILINRKWKRETYTISTLSINGKYFCDVIEDKDRNLDSSMSLDTIKSLKKKGITAIPTGTYEVTLSVVSPKLSLSPFYKKVCQGRVPRLLNVKGFDGVLIHAGNSAEDSEGCLIVGLNKEKGKVLYSRDTFTKLYDILKQSKEKITLKIM